MKVEHRVLSRGKLFCCFLRTVNNASRPVFCRLISMHSKVHAFKQLNIEQLGNYMGYCLSSILLRISKDRLFAKAWVDCCASLEAFSNSRDQTSFVLVKQL